MKKLETLGLVAFLAGLVVFLLTATLGHYRIDGAALDEASTHFDEAHRAAVRSELESMAERWYSSVFSFVRDVERKVAEADEALGADVHIWDHQRESYTVSVVRASASGPVAGHTALFFVMSILLASVGALIHFLPRLSRPAGIKNDGVMFSSSKSRGWIGIALGLSIIGFYVVLYFFPAYITNWIRLADPLSHALRAQPADRWFFYGTMYTAAVLVMGVRMAINYRHSNYHLVRTSSVMFFQLGFAFVIPAIMARLNQPQLDLKLAWPLDYSFTYDYRVDGLVGGGAVGWALLVWGVALALIVVPALAAFFGKRWYCSWVCGCGGLAETLGDPWRHQSDKSLRAWKVERWMVHGVLVFAVVLTAVVLGQRLTGAFGDITWRLQSWYGFLIGSIFAGVVGTGFYPLMGNRVWCRFGCPLAAILGLVQKFRSRFRITVNGGQCISCGNCSAYCEMGIDVRWYAQRGQNIIRASCVGCGVCAAVCPRGVLRLENGPIEGRYNSESLVQLGAGAIDLRR